ncbi:MAG: GNAT family N-acetyltransferase, partial [Oscillospiraceae bacterium]|nr:GNAT family N-acetyltransferase [Oscillospiraceae bacterium]
MSDFTIRGTTAADVPALTRLWAETFGDPEALIADFFRLLPGMGFGLAAEAEGRILGAAYAVTGLDLALPDGKKKTCGYLYAVAVDPSARSRGAGRALSRACAETARRLGCAVFCTEPADLSLFDWYEEILGLRCALRRREERVPAAALEFCMELSATDYRYWRERMLADLPHVRLGDAALLYQHSLCRRYGGGFYAVGDGVAAAYRDGERCVVRELLAPA